MASNKHLEALRCAHVLQVIYYRNDLGHLHKARGSALAQVLCDYLYAVHFKNFAL